MINPLERIVSIIRSGHRTDEPIIGQSVEVAGWFWLPGETAPRAAWQEGVITEIRANPYAGLEDAVSTVVSVKFPDGRIMDTVRHIESGVVYYVHADMVDAYLKGELGENGEYLPTQAAR